MVALLGLTVSRREQGGSREGEQGRRESGSRGSREGGREQGGREKKLGLPACHGSLTWSNRKSNIIISSQIYYMHPYMN